MKNWTSTLRLALCSGALFTLGSAMAQDSTSTPPAVAAAPPPVATAPGVAASAPEGVPPRLPYGVADVLKLSRAQVSEDIIQGYIQNSGTIYSLTPNDIVYLRDQGVSDRIITTMLDQRKRVNEAVVATAPAPAPAPAPVAAPSYAEAATAASAPTVVDTTPAPAPSTLYVIPYAPATTPFYGYSSPYYYGSYWGGYCGPSISFGLGFGGGWGHGGYYGGYHGGYHGGYGGGYHGGYRGGWHGHR